MAVVAQDPPPHGGGGGAAREAAATCADAEATAPSGEEVDPAVQPASLEGLVRGYVARVVAKATCSAEQQPLLPEHLPAGVVVAVARRSKASLARFFGRPLPSPAEPREGEPLAAVAGSCLLAVCETSLVHYTRRPKGVPQPVPAPAPAGDDDTGSSAVDDKYWKRRYNYFARFDEGIRMDVGAWFEVTPESIARHIADRMPFGTIVDGTAGVGGNAIQFAMTSQRVIAVDLDADRLRDAAHNAAIYGVRERMEFVCDDFVHFARTYKGPPVDAVFLSPPWGGPAHLDAEFFSLRDVDSCDIVGLFAAAASMCPRVVLYLPRHQDLHEMVLLASAHGFAAVEVEKIFFEYPTPHLKVCVIHFTPEVTANPTRVRTSKKTVGPTGSPAVRAPPARAAAVKPTLPAAAARAPPARAAVAPARGGGANPLLDCAPLAGPVLRALYCRLHYVGKYVVAVAMRLERERGLPKAAQAAKRRAGCGARPDRREQAAPPPPPPGAREHRRAEGAADAPPQRQQPAVWPAPPPAVAADPAAQFRRQAAGALFARFAGGEEQVLGCLLRLAGELDLGDLTCLAVDADELRWAGGQALPWSARFFTLLRERFPEHHRALLDWRKAQATHNVPADGGG